MVQDKASEHRPKSTALGSPGTALRKEGQETPGSPLEAPGGTQAHIPNSGGSPGLQNTPAGESPAHRPVPEASRGPEVPPWLTGQQLRRVSWPLAGTQRGGRVGSPS